jgi:DNA-directed RNA polymerase subunit RPC12/RpoP
MESDMKIAEVEYQKRLSRFKKYRKEGVDIAYRCHQCGRLVYRTNVLHGTGCRKCGSNRLTPITESLTWFGLYYCLFWNWFWNWWYEL